MKKNAIRLIAMAGACAMLVTGCGAPKTTGDSGDAKIDLNSLSYEELVSKAQEDGKVDSVGMPDSWANWVGTWTDIETKFGIEHTDSDMSSAEELAVFESEKKNATKDIGDVGQAFGPVAESKGLTMPYKTSYWDEIPDWAKDDNGDWIIGYYGTMTMMINQKLVPTPPTSFADLLDGDYMIAVGDVAKANQSQFAVLAAAIAMGGDESNIDPALEFFKKIAEQGRLDKGEFSLARIEKGEVGVAFLWDYNALGYRDQIKANNASADFVVNIPQEGSVQSGYCTIINAYTQRPYAAALAREYILSDEGQINLAKGYAKPIRDVELPADVKAKLIDDAQYQNARMVEDQEAWEATLATIGQRWQEEVMAYAK